MQLLLEKPKQFCKKNPKVNSQKSEMNVYFGVSLFSKCAAAVDHKTSNNSSQGGEIGSKLSQSFSVLLFNGSVKLSKR